MSKRDQIIRDYHFHYFALLRGFQQLVKTLIDDNPGSTKYHTLYHRIDQCLKLVNPNEYFFECPAFRFEMQLIMEQINFDDSPYRQTTTSPQPPAKMRRKSVYPEVPDDPFWSSVSASVFGDDDHATTGIEKTLEWGTFE